jgi:hypothetical protein
VDLQLALPITVTESNNKPYRVQPLRQFRPLRSTANKVSHDIQLLSITCFESSGVVENVTTMVREG